MENELTRKEYLQLLYTAKVLGKERIYFLIKALCCVGLKIGELPQFTVEMLEAGEGTLISKGTERTVHISPVIGKELLAYAERHNISEGVLFRTSTGQPLDRISCFNMIRELAEKADIPVEKCSPKAFRKLYLQAQEKIYENLDYIVKQQYEQLLMAEQRANEWNFEKEETV